MTLLIKLSCGLVRWATCLYNYKVILPYLNQFSYQTMSERNETRIDSMSKEFSERLQLIEAKLEEMEAIQRQLDEREKQVE